MYFKKYKFPFSENENSRVQKIAINAGFDCPNRDGSKAYGGCIFCNNDAFIPFYSSEFSNVEEQINKGINFFSKKYKTDSYLAYFQAYTNTNAKIDEIKKIYDPIVSDDRFIGIVVGTRPDCINEEILEYFKSIQKKKYLKIEYGLETLNDKSLEFCNRGHSAEESIKAIEITLAEKIPVGVHFILGLPLDDYNSIITNSKIISEYNIDSIKLHQLQILKNTVLEKKYLEDKSIVELFTAEKYVNLVVDFLEYLNPEIGIERLINEIPPKYLIAPKWGGLRSNDIIKMVEAEFSKRNYYQGIKFIQKSR